MTKTKLLFLLFIGFVLANCQIQPNLAHQHRMKQNINRDWRFTFGDPDDDPCRVNYNDSSWQKVGLPHSFSIPYFRSHRFYTGYGWYRKKIQINDEWLTKNISLEFDGVFQVAEIYVNGEKAGEHRGGYTGFTLDISPFIKSGENILAVRVNNIWDPKLAPRAGEHVFSGGIYRDVYLTVTNPVHISWNGTFVSTPNIDRQKADVNIKTEIVNSSSEQKEITVETIFVNEEQKEIARLVNKIIMNAGDTVEVEQQTKNPVKNPELWSPENPVLYTAKTVLSEGKNTLDTYETKFGFRWFEWTADKGFFLNGEHLYLEGANVHQDHAGWGDAVTHAGIYRDLKLMKDAGFNFVRGSHYPHHPYFTEVCDKLGLLFLPENVFWGIGGFKKDGFWNANAYPTEKEDEEGFEESVKIALAELIKINKNSPSVIAWSMSNEPFFVADSLAPKMKELLTESVKLSHKLDPTRKAVIGGAQRKGVDVLGDIAGYNGDGATLYRDPGFPNFVSEYGSCIFDRPGEYIPCWGHIENGEKPLWRSGHAIWCGFDHGSIADKMGKMGIVDFYRIPKRSWYWYREKNLNIPPPEWPKEGTPAKLKLFADKTTIQGTNATDDVHLNVMVLDAEGNHISNSPDVILQIISGPGEFPTGRSITFTQTTKNDIKILDGHAAIEFRSYEGGVSEIVAKSKDLEGDTIRIVTEGLPVFVEGETELVKDRPYINFADNKDGNQGNAIIVSDARPTKSNSSNTGYGKPLYANDGNFNTVWKPELTNNTVWWELDMENFYRVEHIVIYFPEKLNCELTAETSEDGEKWLPAVSKKYQVQSDLKVELTCNTEIAARFFRLKINDIKNQNQFGVTEIKVYGSFPTN